MWKFADIGDFSPICHQKFFIFYVSPNVTQFCWLFFPTSPKNFFSTQGKLHDIVAGGNLFYCLECKNAYWNYAFEVLLPALQCPGLPCPVLPGYLGGCLCLQPGCLGACFKACPAYVYCLSWMRDSIRSSENEFFLVFRHFRLKKKQILRCGFVIFVCHHYKNAKNWEYEKTLRAHQEEITGFFSFLKFWNFEIFNRFQYKKMKSEGLCLNHES